jgi:hypothetical protein
VDLGRFSGELLILAIEKNTLSAANKEALDPIIGPAPDAVMV